MIPVRTLLLSYIESARWPGLKAYSFMLYYLSKHNLSLRKIMYWK